MLHFLKLGGSLITDKAQAYTARRETIRRLAEEVRASLEARRDLRLLIGHGSGSFGHRAARPYGTREGVWTRAEWLGYAEVAAAAARLNRIVTDVFLEVGVPVLSIQPSASARCLDGQVVYLDVGPIGEALDHGLVPLVYGDVARDQIRGGTIASTENLFAYLADELEPDHILLLSRVPGVLDRKGTLIPRISPEDVPALREILAGAQEVDVTGGMADKVERMVSLVRRRPQMTVDILTGTRRGLLKSCLLDPGLCAGTRIQSADHQRNLDCHSH